MSEVQAMIEALVDRPTYEQDEPGDAAFRMLLAKGEVPGLQVGHVTLNGPMRKTPAAHGEWHQVYLVIKGSGHIQVGDDGKQVNGPTVVVIPRNVNHYVEVGEGESIEYVYINQYRYG